MVGASFGPYRVTAHLGQGGMGDVYRARDDRLDRDVAIKVLPLEFTADADRLARFEREAKMLASLNHPNIAAIYGLERAGDRQCLVLELVEGRTLADLMAHGALPVDETLPVARQIAEGLEAAHDRGVVHRDLKPGNVMIDAAGRVKLLDFGLAKAVDGSGGETSDLMNSPTMSARATQAGIILGTAPYMSPEQARGRAVDKRTDIWAFGVVLFEMLTGTRLFDGETVTDVVAAVLTRPIDLTTLPAATPPRMRDLVARCLERDPKRRLRDIGEARLALETPAAVSSMTTSSTQPLATLPIRADRRSTALPWAVAIAASIAAAALGWVVWQSAAVASGTGRVVLEIGRPDAGPFIIGSNAGGIVISPDGSTVAFIVQTAAGRRLHVRSLATGETRELSGTVDVHYPFWSPDSRTLGFFGSSKMYTVSIAGGLPEAVADIYQGRGGTWTDAGEILFTPVGGGTIHRVPARGGAVQPLTTLDDSRGENAHYWPVALPGGRKFLFFIRSTRPENNGIYLGSLDGGAHVRLVTSLSAGIFAPPQRAGLGHLLWVRDGELLAQPLDIDAGTLTGDVKTIASDVRVEDSQRCLFASVSTTGTLVWASARAGDLTFGWYDRTGRRLEALPIAPGKVVQPRISPDDNKLAFTRVVSGTADIWVHDFKTGTTTQVTTDPDYDENAAWRPDGRALGHQGRTKGRVGILLTTIDGSEPQRAAFLSGELTAGVFLPDGRRMVYSRASSAGSERELAVVDLHAPEVVVPLTRDPGVEDQPALSPDASWLAFVSDRSGRPEVVLTRVVQDGASIRVTDQRLAVSTSGGTDPHWRRDGRELLYLAPDGTITAVQVTITGNAVALGRPAALFPVTADAGGSGSNWTADADHTRFVIVEAPQAAGQTFRVLTRWW